MIPIAQVRYAFGGGGGRVSALPFGALEVSLEGTRFIAFDDRRKMGAALALGFILGAAVIALSATREPTARNQDS